MENKAFLERCCKKKKSRKRKREREKEKGGLLDMKTKC
jgi:hypothetical protein